MNSVSFAFGVASSSESATDLVAPVGSTEADSAAFGAALEKSCALAPTGTEDSEQAETDTEEDPSQAAYAAMIAASTLASANPEPAAPPSPASPSAAIASDAKGPSAAHTEVAFSLGASLAGTSTNEQAGAAKALEPAPTHEPAVTTPAGETNASPSALDGDAEQARTLAETRAYRAGSSVKSRTESKTSANALPPTIAEAAAAAAPAISIAGLTPVAPTTVTNAPAPQVSSAAIPAPAPPKTAAPTQALAAGAALASQASQVATSPVAGEPRASTSGASPLDRAKGPGAISPASQAVRPARTRPMAAGATASASARIEGSLEESNDAQIPAITDGTQGQPGNAQASGASATEGRVASAPTAGALTPNDDRLTNVNATTPPSPGVEMGSAHRGGREQAIETAARAADRHAISRGVHAEIELGDAGRVQVHASRPDEQIHVRLDADAASTARALGEHARDLARELQTNAHDARVTVSGPTTHASVTSEGSARGDRNMAGGNGSSQGRDERSSPTANDDGAHATRATKAVGGARARFVL